MQNLRAQPIFHKALCVIQVHTTLERPDLDQRECDTLVVVGGRVEDVNQCSAQDLRLGYFYGLTGASRRDGLPWTPYRKRNAGNSEGS